MGQNGKRDFLRKKFSGDFIKHGGLMFVATSLSGIFNIFYQLYMVRNLSPVDYGVLNSLLALLMFFSVPAGTLQTAITKFTSTFHAHSQWKKIKIFITQFTKKISFFGFLFFLTVALGSKAISSFLQLSNFILVIIVGILIFLSVILPVSLGGLQGLQLFGNLGQTIVISSVLKLAFGIILVSFGFKVVGALFACIGASLSMLILAFFPLRSHIFRNYSLASRSITSGNSGQSSDEFSFSEVYKYFLPVAIVLLCLMALTNSDVILVKHFFTPLKAGYYSIAQMVGKIILFLPGAITMVMFPKTSNLHARGKDTLSILKNSLLIVGFLCGSVALFCLFFPSLIIKILAGKEYVESISLVRLFVVTMTFFALLYNLLFYQLSIHQLKFIYPLIFLTVLQIILIIFFHNSLFQVLYILCVNSFFLFIINICLVKRAASCQKAILNSS